VTEVSPEDWGNRYRATRATYDSMTTRLRVLIADLISDAGIDVIQIEARTKSIESFVEKISRKGKKYKNPLVDMTDLVGLRIITYYREDVTRIGEVLKGEFQIDEKNSVDKTALLDADRFGYMSVHYIASLSPARRELAEWKQYADIRAEIQIRTALQHAWSAVQHKLEYKSSTEAPRELRRRLFRLSALFELADEQFSELRDARARIETEYAEEVRNGQLHLPLDEASLTAYLYDSGKREIIAKMITGSGGKISEQDEKSVAKDRRDLLRLLNLIGISTIAQLDGYLSENITSVPVVGTAFFRKVEVQGVEDALTMLIMADKRVGSDVFSAIYLPDSWDNFARLMETWHGIKAVGRNGLFAGCHAPKLPAELPVMRRISDIRPGFRVNFFYCEDFV
jgi:putative GTP pyrophosphokinase